MTDDRGIDIAALSHTEQLIKLLQVLPNTMPNVHGAILVSCDGLWMASSLMWGMIWIYEDDLLPCCFAAALSIGELLVQHRNLGQLHEVRFNSSTNALTVVPIGTEANLAVLSDPLPPDYHLSDYIASVIVGLEKLVI